MRLRLVEHYSVGKLNCARRGYKYRMFIIVDTCVGLTTASCVSFCKNLRQNALEQVRREYEGKCINGNLLLRVVDVLNVGNVVMNDRRDRAAGHVSVVFRSLALSCKRGDTIGPLVMEPRKSGASIILKGKHVNASIDWDENVGVIAAGAHLILEAIETYAGPRLSFFAARGRLIPMPGEHNFPVGGELRVGEENPLLIKHYVSAADAKMLIGGAGGAESAALTPLNIIDAAVAARDYLKSKIAALADVSNVGRMLALVAKSLGTDIGPSGSDFIATNLIDIAKTAVASPASLAGVTMIAVKGPTISATVELRKGAQPQQIAVADLPTPAPKILAILLERYVSMAVAVADLIEVYAEGEGMPALNASSSYLLVIARRNVAKK